MCCQRLFFLCPLEDIVLQSGNELFLHAVLKAVLRAGCEQYHYLHQGLCVLDCPESFFEHEEQKECLRCHPDCALCDGPQSSDCDACAHPDATLHNGSLEGSGHCVPSANLCSPRQYADQEGECHPCHKYCHRCSGPSKSHCLSCNQRHLLHRQLYGTCVTECPVGFYRDELEQKCEPCHPSCQSCIGKSSRECLGCKTYLFREGKETCEMCDPSCGECVSGGEDGCMSCAPGLVHLRKEGRCLPSCPQGFYHDTVHRTCEPCHASCPTCSGTNCRNGFVQCTVWCVIAFSYPTVNIEATPQELPSITLDYVAL
uniref:Growth factor receptor domain-containing protein n=1 Tax=Mola mola TaxID=94237 RepID=A0A3Q3W1N2_MOLML